MFGGCVHEEGSRRNATPGSRSTLSRAWTCAGTLTVLLLLLMTSQLPAQGQQGNTTDLREFEFVCEFQLPMGRGRLDGWMASEGSRRRITIYWTGPDVYREGPPFIHHVDLIFTPDSWRIGSSLGPNEGISLCEPARAGHCCRRSSRWTRSFDRLWRSSVESGCKAVRMLFWRSADSFGTVGIRCSTHTRSRLAKRTATIRYRLGTRIWRSSTPGLRAGSM